MEKETETNWESLTDEVMDKALNRFSPDIHELERFRRDVRCSLEAGWSSNDILAFMSNTEEMNPTMEESVALARMSKINARNKTNFGSKNRK